MSTSAGSLKGSAPSQVFEPGASPSLASGLTVAAVLAVCCILLAQLSPIVQVILTAAVLASWFRALQRDAWRTASRSIIRLSRREDGRWESVRRDGTTAIGQLRPESFVHAGLVVVAIGEGWRRTRCAVPADALGPDSHRRLRALVRWDQAGA